MRRNVKEVPEVPAGNGVEPSTDEAVMVITAETHPELDRLVNEALDEFQSGKAEKWS